MSMTGFDGNIVIGTTVDMYGMNTGLNKIKDSLKKLSAFAGLTLGIAGLVKFGKAALDASSDVQEVQNVVDVSFGEMSWMVDKFADTCIEKFGMSELAAKQTAGSYMAMGKSLGVAKDQAAQMAINLTGLTGDMASFYNISQDYARIALSAVYTGETETLKRYGIVLTEANLQEFAHSKGIETSVKKMDAASKALLRYQYILKATKDMQGDFARTSSSWANQIRLLQESWKQLLITMGNGLRVVFTPMIAWMNKTVKALISFVNVLGKAIADLFGITWSNIEADIKQTNDDIGDATGGMEDLGDATKDTYKASKKLLAPYDELNNVVTSTADAADDTNNFGLGDIFGKVSGGGFSKKALENLLPDFKDLYDIGKELSKALRDMLANIDWNGIYRKARQFGKGLADYLNGLIRPDTFEELGKTIANALNAAVISAFTFAKNFDWKNLGESLAAGVNSLFKNFNWAFLGKTITTWAKGLITTIVTFLKKTDWKMIGESIGTLLKNIDWIGILKGVGQIIWEAINAAVKFYIGMFETAPFETIVATIIGIFALLNSGIGQALIGVVSTMVSFVASLSGPLTTLAAQSPILAGISSAITSIQLALSYAFDAILAGGGAMGALTAFFGTISELMPPVAGVIITIVSALMDFFTTMNAFSDLMVDVAKGTGTVESFVKEVGEIVGAFAAAGVACSMVFGFPTGVIVAAVISAIGLFAGLVKAIDEVNAENYKQAFQGIVEATESGTHSLEDYKQAMYDTAAAVTAGTAEMNDKYKELEKGREDIQKTVTDIGLIGSTMQATGTLTKDEIDKLNQSFESIKDTLADVIAAQYDYLIAQQVYDMQYLNSLGQLSEAEKKRYTENIANLQQQKESAINEAGAVVESVSSKIDILSKLKEEYDQGKVSQEYYEFQVGKLSDALLEFGNITSQYNLTQDETSKIVDEASDAMSKLSGQLKLSAEDIKDVNNLDTELNTTVTTMQETFTNAVAAINEESENYIKALDNMGYSEQEREQKLEEHNKVVSDKLGKLASTYSSNLNSIQADLTNLVPIAMEEMGKKWDDMTWIEKAFSGYQSKDDYIKSNTEKFINDVYSKDGKFGTSLDEAFKQLGVEGGVWGSDAMKSSVDSMFDTFYNESTFMTESVMKPAWKQSFDDQDAFIDKYISEMDMKGKGETISKDIVAGLGLGFDTETGTIEINIKNFTDTVLGYINDWFGIHSPSTETQTTGQYLVEGLNQGLEDNAGTTNELISQWVSELLDLFIPLTDGVKTIFSELPEFIKDSFYDLRDWFNEMVIESIISSFDYMNETIENAFDNLWDNIGDAGRGGINGVIDAFEDGINNIINLLNKFLDGFNDIIDKVNDISGKSFHHIPTIGRVSIPRLAQGAVLPPNKPFMAMVGDQKSGTNVEAPLSTIQEALYNALIQAGVGGNNNSQDIVVQIDGREVARAVRREDNIFRKSTGNSMFAY